MSTPRDKDSLPRIVALSALLVMLLLLPGVVQPLASARGFDTGRDHVRIGVLGLFHPQQFEVKPLDGTGLVLRAEGEQIVLERSSGPASANVRISGGRVDLVVGTHVWGATSVVISGHNGKPVDFALAIPGKISRHYRGTLEITSSADSLLAVLDMDRESAVASIVAAESNPDTPLEALKAQAIATRSYLLSARGRHHDFDFCDTTHCQFLREAPDSGSSVANAVAATRGMILAYNAQPFPAMYTRSCAGRTRTPTQVGLTNAAYPYYSVDCDYCRRHPQHWTSHIPAEAASALRDSNESSRLEIDRRLGWSAVPSNDFVSRKEGGEIVLTGAGNGHGIGLCQAGAKAMAANGANFREILDHYYPNTTVMIWPDSPDVAHN